MEKKKASNLFAFNYVPMRLINKCIENRGAKQIEPSYTDVT